MYINGVCAGACCTSTANVTRGILSVCAFPPVRVCVNDSGDCAARCNSRGCCRRELRDRAEPGAKIGLDADLDSRSGR